MSEPSTDHVGATYDRRAEVEAILAEDDTVLGRYWRYLQDGLTKQEMTEREGLASRGWTSNYEDLLRSLRDGRIPTSPTLARGSGQRIRAWLKAKPLSPALRADLIEQERVLASVADDRQAQQAEDAGAVQATVAAERTNTPGIYVYTLPHYIRYPYDPDSGRTLLKVGHSSRDALYRATFQGRLTALPEDPTLLRIYPVDESAAAEHTFHAWLRDADHAASRTQRGGNEWFLTSTKFLDRIAKSLGLDVRVVNEFDVGTE